MMLLEVGWSCRLAPVLFPVKLRVPQPVPSVLCEHCVCSAGMSPPAAGRQIFTCSADTRPGRLREKGPPPWRLPACSPIPKASFPSPF